MKKALVISNIAPLMLKCGHIGELDDEVISGMVVEILEELEDGWLKIRTHYKYESYIHKDNLLIDDTSVVKWESVKKHVVTHTYCDVLDIPKVQGAMVQSLTKGALLIVTGEKEGHFIPVLLANGKTGFIRHNYIKEEVTKVNINEEELREKLVETAFSYLTVQYRWGGKTTLGIDCSGLCSMAYLLNGIIIYRNASIIEGFPIKKIPFENIKKGDLLYFPGHIGMYIEDGKYIHSSSGRGGVYVNSLNVGDEYYDKYLAENILYVGSYFA